MILSKDQINRYLRHIIIPEISGKGQKKIVESKVFISAATAQEASSLIYYLAASGVGYISCYFKENDGYENLFSNIRDLNDDTFIELTDNKLLMAYKNALNNDGFEIRILFCNYENLKESLINFSNSQDCSKFVPTIVAITCGWNGFLQTFSNQEDFDCLLSNPHPLDLKSTRVIIEEKEGYMLSSSLLGVLTSIECIKLCLNMGSILDKPLSFNLLSMEFSKLKDKNLVSTIDDYLKNNYSNTSLYENCNNKKLSDAKVLIVGTGGLGSPAAFALSILGIGTIGLVDYDKVDISNLNRQILHSTSRIGMSKVESAEAFIKNLNSKVKVVTYNTSFNIDNAKDIINDYDLIIDAVDNFHARYLLNDSCYFANKPLVDAAAVRFHGLIMTILPKKGPCYRCNFPAVANKSGAMSCSEAGVLGPVPGVMGFLQAAEVIKLLLDKGNTLCNRIIYYDALDCDFDTINTEKSVNCDICGAKPTITTLTEYNNTCENKKY